MAEWYTRQLEVLVGATPWRFKSSRPQMGEYLFKKYIADAQILHTFHVLVSARLARNRAARASAMHVDSLGRKILRMCSAHARG